MTKTPEAYKIERLEAELEAAKVANAELCRILRELAAHATEVDLRLAAVTQAAGEMALPAITRFLKAQE